jgi:murein DD-endopeptidase MepM/ murein hydrolase activator NlpD
MPSVSGFTALREVRIPSVRRDQKSLPPWIDPSPAGDPTYDPFGTSLPFRPTHRTPGSRKSKHRSYREFEKDTGSGEARLQRFTSTFTSAFRENLSWRLAEKSRLPRVQSALLPLTVFAGTVTLLIAGTSVLYAEFLPDHHDTTTQKTSYASDNNDQSTELSSPGDTVGSGGSATEDGSNPENESPGPAIIDPATRDEFRAPVPGQAVGSPNFASHTSVAAADIDVPIGTPVFAVHAGRASIIDSIACGTGVAIDGSDGNRYTYCFASQLDIANGAQVKAGDIVMHSGTPTGRTGPAGTATESDEPHLHFEVRVAGVNVCPQHLLRSWFDNVYLSPSDPSTDRHSCVVS